ncbi:glycosyl hydrolase 115 family protein [Amycolatopsis sp.]|uniref:glycosyl hydrolase 115 family protein n=1 Tax=Amycolatopsis sp. TaxID=37632 RepID=UPI002D7EC763|nr:glycosyl hydrolase 115 family protein [Amycolatopsis sp.]HET6708440.1 glycosyl hydrolase 115 family protein [Amycolatopsis sp.]
MIAKPPGHPDDDAFVPSRRSFLRGLTAAGVLPLVPAAVSTLAAEPAAAAVDGFPLVAGGVAADVFVDAADDVAVRRVAGDLQADVERVSGVLPILTNRTTGLSRTAVLIGTIGHSPVIDKLVAAGRLDVAEVAGRWEASVTQVVEAPIAGVDRALVIAGSDRRGTIYGVYDLSERIGVSPWYWWADVPVPHRDTVTVAPATEKRREPAIRYRGIFLNDEDNLSQWAYRTAEPGKHIGPVTYTRIFELMLRLKANYLWPAMHPESDHFNKYPDNARLAHEYGIVVGSSHPEALLRNNVHEWQPWAEAHRNPDGSLPEYDFTVNPKTILDYWRARAKANARYESVWTVGMRGIHDSGLVTKNAKTTAERVAVMNDIITQQRRILADEVGPAAGAVPQIFIPYKEVLDLYNAGVRVPDDVTLIWPDDNHGNMRQLPTAAERQRSGGNGLYYHISYWGSPKSYLWLDTTAPAKIWQELRRAYDNGVRHTWIVNVGDLKSQETGLSLAMELAWDIDRWRAEDVHPRLAEWAGRQFGAAHAREIAEIRQGYYELAAALRPEFIQSGVFSLVHHGDEAERRMAAYRSLIGRAEAVGRQLPSSYQDAFFELLLYPLTGAYLMNLKFVCADRNALAVKQGRGAGVNVFAGLAERAQADEEALTRRYNTAIAGGKWKEIINPYPANVPKAPRVPAVTRRTPTNAVGLGVAAEGNETGVARPLTFSSYPRNRRFIDVFNTGFAPLSWQASPSHSWVQVSTRAGTTPDQARIWVGVDWAAAPAGVSGPEVRITGAGTTVTVPLQVVNDGERGRATATGFVEALGYVSIEAEHHDRLVPRSGATWQTVPGLGRSGAAVIGAPFDAARLDGDSRTVAPELQYNVRFATAGTFPVTVYRLPSLDARGTRRLAIGLDAGTPILLKGTGVTSATAAWSRNVVEGIEKLTTSITVDRPGEHVLKLWMVDPGNAVDQIVVDTGGLPASYLAPPESFHPAFNPNPGQ